MMSTPNDANVASEDSARNVEAETKEKPEPSFQTRSWKRTCVLIGLLILIAISSLPFFLIGSSLPSVVADIGGQTTYTWLALVNSLATAAVAPFAGALSDLIGRRYLALAASLITIVGMIVVGTAHRMPVAIGGMALAGVGAGIALPIGIAGIVELVPVNQRGLYLGTVYLVFTCVAASPAYATMYSVSSTWRWGAWIPIIIAGVGFFILLFSYHPPPRQISTDWTRRETVRRIDYIGGILSIAGTTLFLLGLTWGGYSYPWRSAHVIATLTVGGALLVVFCIWEVFGPHRMIPRNVFLNNRNAFLTLFIVGMGGACAYVLSAFWIVEMQQFYGDNAYSLARKLTAFGFAYVMGACLVSWAIDLSHGAIRELLFVASCITTAGIGSLAAIRPSNPSMSIGLSVLASFGIGAIYIPPIVALVDITLDEYLGTIVGLAVAVRLIVGQAAYAIFYHFVNKKLTDTIPITVGTAVLEAGLPITEVESFIEDLVVRNFTAIAGLHGVTPQILQAAETTLDDCFVRSFKVCYFAGIGFAGAAVIASVFLKNIRRYLVDRVAVDIH